VSCINFIEPLLYFLVISGSANSREKDNKVKIGLRSLPAARISEFPKVGLGMIDSAGTWIRLSV
jgi:hypothetical protein